MRELELFVHHNSNRLKRVTLTVTVELKKRSPVAVDGDGDDEQHGHDDSRDDDVEGQIILSLVLHRADHPLSFPKFDLWINTERQIYYRHKLQQSRGTFSQVSVGEIGPSYRGK